MLRASALASVVECRYRHESKRFSRSKERKTGKEIGRVSRGRGRDEEPYPSGRGGLSHGGTQADEGTQEQQDGVIHGELAGCVAVCDSWRSGK